METKPLPVHEGILQITHTLAQGKPCRLVVTGTSMLPFLRHKTDSVILSPNPVDPRRGDILFYLRSPDCCILHRVHKVRPNGVLIMCGDAQTWFEPIRQTQIVARVSHVERGGKLINCRALSWRLATAIWQALFPVRPHAMALLHRMNVIQT